MSAAHDLFTFLQQLVNGLSLGAVYALIAIGYTMVYGVLKLINFAHGDVYMIGAYAGFFAVTAWHWPLWAAIPAAMAICAAIGMVIERLAYRPIRSAPTLIALITAMGVSMLLENLGIVSLSAQSRSFSQEVFDSLSRPVIVVQLPGSHSPDLSVSFIQLLIMGAALVLMVGLHLFVMRTLTGKAMQAVSMDKDAARLMGIDVDGVISLTFAIGSALAAVAGVLVGLYYNSINPVMGLLPGLKAFVAAVLGGIGNIPGAMVGGLLMGIVEAFVVGPSSALGWLLVAALGVGGVLALARGLGRTVRPAAAWIGGLLLAAALWLWLAHGAFATAVGRESLSTFKDGIAFVILILILLVRPSGLLGKGMVEKV